MKRCVDHTTDFDEAYEEVTETIESGNQFSRLNNI